MRILNTICFVLARLLSIGLLLYSVNTQALITIEIDKGIKSGLPIAVVPFENGDLAGLPFTLDEVIRNDLQRTGRFSSMHPTNFLSEPTRQNQIRFVDWRLIKVDYLVVGGLSLTETGQFELRIQLFDVLNEKQVFGRKFQATSEQLRDVAHGVADLIFAEITGGKSSFSSNIAFVSAQTGSDGKIEHVLYIADYDGYDPVAILQENSPILSPTWSPDSKQIAYAVLEPTGSKIYVQTIGTGARVNVVETDARVSAPSWSPDGSRIAFTLLYEGNSDIYIVTLNTGQVSQITTNDAIDTEPSWSPDGKNLIFTSARGSSTQIYSVPVNLSSEPQRITFAGSWNASAKYDTKGEKLIMISQQEAGYQIVSYDLEENSLSGLTSTNFNESPSVSPEGDMIMYIVEGRERQLMIISPDGRVKSPVPIPSGQIKQASWESKNNETQ